MKVLGIIVSYDATIHRFSILNAFPGNVFNSFLSICRVVEFASKEMIAE